MNGTLVAAIEQSEHYLSILRQWAERDIYRNPLDNSLVINYPPITATQPVTSKNERTIRGALGAVRAGSGVALYVHIPFCSRRCTFCNYFTVSGRTTVPESFVTLLVREINEYAKLIDTSSTFIQSIYIGGGTPSLLTEQQVDRILGAARAHWAVSENAEITMEFHPEIVNRDNVSTFLARIKALGINRVSVGIQSLDQSILRATRRGHTREEAMACLNLLAEPGFSKLNVDIIYGGLPFQSLSSMHETMSGLIAFRPTSITKHFCELKKGSQDYSRYMASSTLYPNWTENVRMATLIDLALVQNGYKKEMLHLYTDSTSTFSHQQQKWRSPETILLAAGPGTYGWIFNKGNPANVAYYKTFSMKSYREAILAGRVPFERVAILDKDETARRHIQYALNYGYLDKSYLESLLGNSSRDTRDEAMSLFQRLISHGFFQETKDEYRFSSLGEFLSDEIKALFASNEILRNDTTCSGHEAHHWYPNMGLVNRFKNIMLGGDGMLNGTISRSASICAAIKDCAKSPAAAQFDKRIKRRAIEHMATV